MNPRASRIMAPSDRPELQVILAAWHRADEVEDRTVDRDVRVMREFRDERLISRAREGTLRHISQ